MDPNAAPPDPTLPAPDDGPVRVLIVSRVCFLRECLAEIFARDSLISLVGTCGDVADIMLVSADLRADVVLLDAGFADGAAAISRIHHAVPEARIAVFAVTETETE